MVIVYTDLMIKRLLMMCLIICTAGYGSVWAFEGHIDEAAEHQAIADHSSHMPGGDGDQSSCDHCCHASAHITALLPSQTGNISPVAGNNHTPYRHTLFFNTTTPPERPPQG